jgi:hypothetical protein
MGGRPEPPPARGSQRARTVDFANPPTSNLPQSSSQHPPTRKLIVPAFPTHATQTQNFDGNRDALDDLHRSASSASTRSLPTRPINAPTMRTTPQVLRKPAPPPIPNKKPALLSKSSTASTIPQYRDDPQPRRSMADRRSEDEAKPPLPPRTGTGLSAESNGRGRGRNLMDDEPEDMGGLRGWEVLQPGPGR